MEFGKIITVDFAKREGKIKPLGGLNAGPLFFACGKEYDLTEDYRMMNVPVIRLADVDPPYGKNQLVDVHCIFPDFDADPELPESYNFTETDKYIAAVRAAGAEPILRLGESPDHYERKLFVKAPKNAEKWASICEHIIAHYNEGFAGGYKWKLRYVEIWDLPELECGFVGNETEFFALYATASAKLKARFPKIKVGGYGSLGFRGLNRIDLSGVYKDSADYAARFLSFQKANGGVLDFFTWYCYAESPEEIALHARYARSTLDGAGFKRAASHIVGFNVEAAEGGTYHGYAADLLASLVTAQRSGVDMLIFEDARPFGARNSLYTIDADGVKFTSAGGALSAFGRLVSLGTAVESLGDSRREIYSLAAIGGTSAALAIAAREYSGKLEIRLKNSTYSSFSVKRIFEDPECNFAERYRANIPLAGNKISLVLEKGDIYLLEFKV